MSILVFGMILLAASLHAIWNAIVKGGGDKLLTIVLVTASAALIAVAALPLLPPPAQASWPFIAASTLFQIGYFVLVAQTYRVTDMSQAYPLMRGTAPLLVAFASAVFLNEALPPVGWLGVAVICAGILSIAVARRHQGSQSRLALPLLNAMVIACYTLIDGLGVRLSGAPVSYTLWIYLLTGIPLAAGALTIHRQTFCRYVASNWHLGLAGGIGTVASYGLALWAMTAAPVSVVAALRETSILFGTAISGLVLKERIGPAHFAAVCIIAIGAVVLRLA